MKVFAIHLFQRLLYKTKKTVFYFSIFFSLFQNLPNPGRHICATSGKTEKLIHRNCSPFNVYLKLWVRLISSA